MDLFDKYQCYSNNGNDLFVEVEKKIGPILDKWFKKGALARDIQHIVHDVVGSHLNFSRAMKSSEMRMKEREESKEQ
jgi:hypothetical protein